MGSTDLELDVIIVGAGLGGLSAAIACALAGHKVRVLESAQELAEVGQDIFPIPSLAARRPNKSRR